MAIPFYSRTCRARPRVRSALVCFCVFLLHVPAPNAWGAGLSRTNLLEYAEPDGAVRPVRSIDDWQRRRHGILLALQEVMGPLPGAEKRCPLDLRILEESDEGDYFRRDISYQSEPGARVPAYLLIPKSAPGATKKFPGILALHQTHRLGRKVVVGLGESPNDEYGVELVRRGFVVLAPSYPLLADYNPDLRRLGYSSGTMKAIRDNIRGLDLLEALPFVKPGKFGAIGHSLGGHNSVYTAVFDARVAAVVSSCGLDSYLDYMNGDIRGWTSERYMPRLLNYSTAEIPFDFHEMIGALAPRKCFLVAPLHDSNFKWQSVDAVAREARKIYALYGRPDDLRVEHPDSGHEFSKEMREEAFRIFEEVLR